MMTAVEGMYGGLSALADLLQVCQNVKIELHCIRTEEVSILTNQICVISYSLN